MTWQLHNYSGPYDRIKRCQLAQSHVDGDKRTVMMGPAGLIKDQKASGWIKCANCDLWRPMTQEEADAGWQQAQESIRQRNDYPTRERI